MNTSNGLSFQENLLIGKHLVERCKNAADDVSDWRQLRIQHHKEIHLVGLLNFDKWDDQKSRIAQLTIFHFEKLTILNNRQKRELEEYTSSEPFSRTVGVGYA